MSLRCLCGLVVFVVGFLFLHLVCVCVCVCYWLLKVLYRMFCRVAIGSAVHGFTGLL